MVWKCPEKLRKEWAQARFGAHSITPGLAYLTLSDGFDVRRNVGRRRSVEGGVDEPSARRLKDSPRD
jgi:hypothetical protein